MPFEFILNVFIEKLNDSIWGEKEGVPWRLCISYKTVDGGVLNI